VYDFVGIYAKYDLMEDGQRGGFFMKMTNIQGLLEEVTNFPKIEENLEVLNSRQCKNLLVNIQNGVETIQSMIDGSNGVDVFHQVEQEMLGIMKKARYMVEECCKVDDWCRVVVMQLNNKESFRELLLDFEYCFHTMCKIFSQSFPSREVEIQHMEKSTTFYPTSIDKVEQDQNAIFERLSKEVDLCRIENCKDHCTLLRYLMERIGGLQKVAGGELDSIIFPYIYEPPEYGRIPKPLGKGGFGSVYATQWLGFETATKVIQVGDLDHERSVWKEACILGGLDHPNIIKFFCCGLSTDGDTHGGENKRFEIVMERGILSLSRFLEGRVLTEVMRVDILIQIASGMCYLHDMKVAHRDLKPDNVILTSMGGSTLEHVHVKILDFGISKIEVKNFPQVPTNMGIFGTPRYMAPEAHTKRSSEVDAFKTDVFSFGTMCYEILSNKQPYSEEKYRDYARSLENESLELPKTCSEDLKSLIHECRSLEPLNRPTFLDISQKLRKFKSDAMLKVASDVRVANILHDTTTPSNSLEYSRRWWTMVKQKLHAFNIWAILLLWQMFITLAQWLPRYIPNSLETNSILSSSAQENSNITTSNNIPYEVTIE
jgi:serine/threonine protein kinase